MSTGEFASIALAFFATGLLFGINIANLIHMRRGK